ncbi:MAG TPA: polyphosphate:AMP phosphotransferase [Candidatus Limivivens intestinipullorum]|uniref:Polyphosphate:AMP phosphotransferase n=1 Tax=Candidatus Limivivens intestinipullorum TaxID=2840858 RepID=A0A9D1JIZ6_9FIRM|nr:polyphosphate:AMP phosphotransferase [Candidatus Limivivens intestinipullorum]
MLEKIDLSKKMSKEEFDKVIDGLEAKAGLLQRECRELKIPVIILFEGFGASGKGTLINSLIHALDPRGFRVYAINGESEDEIMRPYLWRFWTKTPEKGRIAIFDRSWYKRVLTDRFDGITSEKELGYAFDEILSFENTLADDGFVILKFFLDITKKEQEKRFEKLLASKETAWRVSKGDLKRNKHFDEYKRLNEEMLQKTDTDFAPWNIVEAVNKEYAVVKIFHTVINRLSEAVLRAKAAREAKEKPSVKEEPVKFKSSILSSVDLSLSMEKEEYRQRRKELQKRLNFLHSELYRRRIPVILGFEGWDAGGKGGAIKRLTECLDPRGYAVHPTASPNDIEKAHHYLWRFWEDIPKAGHITIFDRTWYGRVMVERIEGFCTENEWRRAYKEMNDMEAQWANYGAIVLKFWLQIDKDEQERRFNERMNTPEKRWKITDEDWRNREKWDQYESAVDEMLIRTSTTYAPWIIVEGNSKYYARIKVLETVVKALEERMKEDDK